MLKEIIMKSRSYRRFYNEKMISNEQLTGLIEFARLSPCGANRQSLKYITVNSPDVNAKVYECCSWAAYMKDWDGPIESERPTAYIVMLRDKSLVQGLTVDEGIAAQSIFLGAMEQGIGGCFIGNIRKETLMKALDITDPYEVALVIALGYPKEEVVIEKIGEDGDVKYWRDENQVHHVPKRSLDDIIVKSL